MQNTVFYKKGLVSVIIPTYRRTDKLERAIESVLSQTYQDIELLLVNDNIPNDEYSIQLIKKVDKYKKDNRFHLLLQDKHINGAVARNFAIKQAVGEYVAFLDDDDWWEPSKIEKQVNALSQLDDSWGGTSCLITQYDANECVIGKTRKYQEGAIYKDVIFMTTDVATGTLLLRHDSLDKAGYFDEKLVRSQDIQLLTRFTYKYKLKLVLEHLHNADHSDSQNRLTSESKFKNVVSAYFESVSDIMETLSKREILCAKCIREFMLGFIMCKQHNIKQGLLYFFKGSRSPMAVWKTIRIFVRKRNEKRF